MLYVLYYNLFGYVSTKSTLPYFFCSPKYGDVGYGNFGYPVSSAPHRLSLKSLQSRPGSILL